MGYTRQRHRRSNTWAVSAAVLSPLFLHSARSEVLALRASSDGSVREVEAIIANWNMAIDDSGKGAFAGVLRFDEEDPGGCGPIARDAWAMEGGPVLALIDSAVDCGELIEVTDRLAEAGAAGVVFFYHLDEGVAGITQGNRDPPSIRAVMIERQIGQEVLQLMALQVVSAELRQGKLISDEAYEEQFIFRMDEIISTRKENFLWHRWPVMLPSSGKETLSAQLMASNFSVPSGWFSRVPAFVPLFNPSLLSLSDGTMLAVLRMSNGPGCPSVRLSRESSMDTRIFRNELVLAHIEPSDLSVSSHVLVETPELRCRFTSDTKVGGRQFLDEVSGPMDVRIARGADDEIWVFFYAERNAAQGNEVERGMHAAPLHVDWRDCGGNAVQAAERWARYRKDAVFAPPTCKWIGSGDGRSLEACHRSCDAAKSCNAVNFREETTLPGGRGQCEMRTCAEGLTGEEVMILPGWQAWLRSGGEAASKQWRRAEAACEGGWLGLGDASSLERCQRSCEEFQGCHVLLFSLDLRACILQRCGADAKPAKPPGEGWQAWHLGKVATGDGGAKKCLSRAWIQSNELIAFPAVNGVEKNWNLIRGERERLFIEYHVEPHIVLEAGLQRQPGPDGGLAVTSLSEAFISRWPYEVLHGVTNVRGGYCCLELPDRLLQQHLPAETWWSGEAAEPDQLPTGPLRLGAGHLQRIRSPFDQAPGDVSRFRRQAKSRTYHQFFYLLRATEPFDVVAVSAEWCITINGHFSKHWAEVLSAGEEACESIQFVAGLALRGEDEVVVGYGINDCESDLLPMPLSKVLGMLRPVNSNLNVSLEDLEMI